MSSNGISPVLSEDQGGSLPSSKSLLGQLDEALEKYPDKIAAVSYYQPKDFIPEVSGKVENPKPYLRWTLRQLSDAADIFATGLAHYGLNDGDTIVYLLFNSIHWPVGLWAALRMGCPWAGISPNEAGLVELVEHKMKVCNAKALFVWDDATATALENSVSETLQKMKLKVIANSGSGVQGWTYFDEIMSSKESRENGKAGIRKDVDSLHEPERMIHILFTSGTTSLPKGVPHTNRTMGACTSVRASFTDTDDSFIAYLPLFHIYGHVLVLGFLVAGAKVVFGSKSFEPGNTLELIGLEKVTLLEGTPSLMSALFAHPSLSETDFTSIKYLELGGTLVQPVMLRDMCKAFGCDIAYSIYGLTEGAPSTMSNHKKEKPNLDQDFVSCGKCAAGGFLRICEPGTRNIVPRGELGEIHQGGAVVPRNYLGKDSEDLYDEDGVPWMATGDQARMHSDGKVEVIGRYKDLVIRGGENLSPGAIEEATSHVPGVEVQVIGIPDDLAGEVPIAVVKMKDSDASIPTHEISSAVRDKLGNLHVPSEIIGIKDLGVGDFPRTSIGKVQKVQLVPMVNKLIQNREQEHSGQAQDIKPILISLWSKLLGQSKDSLSADTSVFDLADSITIMQFCNKLEKQHGYRINPQDLMEYPTIKEQAEFLKSQNDGKSEKQLDVPVLPPRDGPPKAGDMAHTMGDEVKAEKTRKAIQPILEKFDLSWNEDVQDVLPVYDWSKVFLERRRPQSWNHRHAFLAMNTDVTKLRLAIEKAFERHPNMRTLSTTTADGTALHFIIRPSTKWFHLSISEGHQVKSEDELPKLEYDNPSLDFAVEPGPMVRCMIAKVGDTGNSSGFVLNLQHSVFDGFSMPNFIDSIDAFLQSDKPSLPALTPYKLFTDMYHQYRTSLQADTDIASFAKSLSGISEYSSAVWPPQRAPEWFKCSDAGWTHPDGTPGNSTERPILDGSNAQGSDGIKKSCSLPGIRQLRQDHGISPPVLIKSALALLNASMNGTHHAQFSNYDAARSWPFLPPWIADRLPNAMSIDGATVSCLYNNISIPSTITVSDLLTKISLQQAADSAHAHVPYFRLLESLSPQDSEHLHSNIRRQIFNWLPGLQAQVSKENQYKEIEKVQQQTRSDVGVLWNCGMVGEEEFLMIVSYDDAQLYAAEVEEAVEGLFGIARWFCEEGSWEREVRECPGIREGY